MRKSILQTVTSSTLLTTILLGMVAFCIPIKAQNVTVSEKTGSMICSQTSYSGGSAETGFSAGGFATWKHFQLPLTMTVSDYKNLTGNGQLVTHANNLYNSGIGQGIQLLGGKSKDGYMTLALPNGYRFTSYKIIVQNNVSQFGTGADALTIPHDRNFYFGETNRIFDFKSGYYKDLGKNISTVEYTVERTNMLEGDMGNVLYFKVANDPVSHIRGEYVGVTLKYIELTFTPENQFTIPVAPTNASSTGVSYMECPFATGKVDVGRISQNTYQNVTRQSYVYTNVKDLTANSLFYEKASVDESLGLNARKVGSATGNKTIKSVQIGSNYYFEIQPGQTYFAETPVSSVDQQGNEVPLHYRITTAKVNYTENKVSHFYITYVSGGTTYYLQNNARFGTAKLEWTRDENGYIYTSVNGSNTYLKLNKANNALITTTNAPTSFGISSNRITYIEKKITYYMRGYSTDIPVLFAPDNNSTPLASWTEETTTTPYILKVYDNTGTSAEEITVNAAGSYELTDLNNDAVKIEVTGGAGLVNLDLTVEALDPYINHMELMCNHGDVKISREFVSNDFSVGGGVFYFYIPHEWLGSACNFTFENLKSNYGDNTYYDGSTNGHARYSFVKSDYYNLFGAANNNIYSNTDAAADYSYTKKVYVETAGTKAFKFNNADEVSQATTSTVLKEYPFSLEAYAAEGGTFSNVSMIPEEEEHDYQTNAFVFTTDETRYNIAPTTATQHRYYAYYDMEIHLIAKTYTPSVAFEKIYDTSFYGDNETGTFYGATISSKDEAGNLGYCSVEAVKELLETKIAAGGTGVPTNMSQLLYLDMGSQMEGTYSIATGTWTTLRKSLGKNALIFLPKNTTREDDNFAYAEEGGTYKATRNIIITDKQPFYSPYKIRVDAANYALYTRELSGPNGQVKKATLMLPFTLALTNGRHVNTDNNCAFDIYTMQATNCLTVSPEQKEGYDYLKFDGDAHFVKPTGNATEANKPYMVLVDEEYIPEKEQSFIAQQYGADIMPTIAHKNQTYLTGESATGAGNGTNYNFENRGTYCGAKVQQVFYFANNKYYSSLNLATDPQEVRVRPFRSYYAFNSSSGAKMMAFNVVFSENNIETTDINNVKTHTDLAVTATGSKIIVYAKTAQRVEIFNMNGLSVTKLNMSAGEMQSVPVTPGVYIINDFKISVK